MIRRIVRIDEEKCSGCGACAAACHESAIEMVNGKARLTREDYCDGLGDCLPACPMNAISFVEREAPAYNEAAVLKNKERKKLGVPFLTAVPASAPAGCPGSRAAAIKREAVSGAGEAAEQPSRLMQWPVQIKLAPVRAPYFDGADLLIAADCTAYAYGGFHERFIKGRVTLVGCPKLDGVDYSEKLSEIIKNNDIKSVTLVRMEVPCCGGLRFALEKALRESGKVIPWRVVVISTDGRILSE